MSKDQNWLCTDIYYKRLFTINRITDIVNTKISNIENTMANLNAANNKCQNSHAILCIWHFINQTLLLENHTLRITWWVKNYKQGWRKKKGKQKDLSFPSISPLSIPMCQGTSRYCINCLLLKLEF